MQTIINIPDLIKAIDKDSKEMYKIIGELEDIYRGYYGHDEQMYLEKQNELDNYLIAYIESMHVKICMVMEFYKLGQLHEQYLKEYEKFNKTELKLYREVDVYDSPVYSMMNKYINALSFITNIDNGNSIIVQNGNSISTENSLHSDTKLSVAVTNKIDLKNILVELEKIKLINKDKETEFQLIVSDLKNSIDNHNEESQIKKQFLRVKDFLCSTGADYVKDELKSQIPILLKMITEFL